MIELIFASNNEHKIKEVQSILGSEFKIFSLKEMGFYQDIIENANTLEGNAEIKAQCIWDKFRKNCFADDTGLEVEALNGEPGVKSARYSGSSHNDKANMQKLLKNLENKTNRKARFRTVICLILNGEKHFFEGIVDGEISHKERGKQGFGYDPIFIPKNYEISFAEMPSNEKNAISHRGKAVKNLCNFLHLRFLDEN